MLAVDAQSDTEPLQTRRVVRLVQRHENDELGGSRRETLRQGADAAVVDDGDKPGTQIGPVQNKMQYEKLKGLLESAKLEGKIIAGGNAVDRDGYFIEPTIVRDVDDSARIVREEQFGPVLPVLKYDDLDEVMMRW